MLPHAPNLTKLLNLAREISQKENQPLTTTQLFGQILASDIKAQRILQKLNISWEKLKDAMIQSLPDAFPELFTEPFASKETKEVLDAAEVLAEKEEFVDVEHLLLAIVQGSTVRGWMDFADFPHEEFEKEVQKLLDFSPVKRQEEEEKENGPPPNMMKYCLNLSAEAMMEGQKTFGREKEISEILDTIVREKKNNVLLIGENGVGRKSICRGVAERILSGRASEFSHKKALWKLDVAKLSSGSGMYGSLESKISSLAAELDEDGDVILVIPDLHTTVGAGGKEGTVDIANLLKPILANPNVPVIGICTQAEYKKYLEKDSSLVNLFEIIRVDEPPEEETRKMIVRSLDSIQEHHLVKVDFAAVDEAISLCKRFLPYRKFPEKAFDVLDITCARKKNAAYVAPEELIKLEESVWDKIEDLASQGFSLEKGTPEYEKISKLEKKVAAKYKKWSENLAKNTPIVSAEDVVSTFVEKFKITENLINQESVQTSDLADRIRQEVHGQDQAVEAVCDVLVCSKAGLRDRTKPLAKFLFVGSSGVGKAQPLDCKIKTMNGWKEMGSIKIGDEIMSKQGSPCHVTGIFPRGEMETYEIEFEDGRKTKATEDHLWAVYSPDFAKKWEIKTTGQIKSKLDKGSSKLYVPLIKQGDESKNFNLPIDPYVMGALIGDGSFRSNSVIFSNKDQEILDKVKSRIGDKYTLSKKRGTCDYTIVFKEEFANPPTRKGVISNEIKRGIVEMNLWGKKSYEKFIPDIYLNASYSQRMQLINGLLDTDGTVSVNGSPSLCTTSIKLADQFVYLIRSVGGIAYYNNNLTLKQYSYNGEKRTGRRHYIVSIRFPEPKSLFSIKRKKDKLPEIYQYADVAKNRELKLRIRKITPIGKEKVQCISVSSDDRLYITDEFIVTHNTMLGRKIAKYYFGDEKAILKLDMSEFQEKHSISSLTGAPPGYIGFDNGGKLTEYVKNNPSCVVLFDEIEKAHPDIANLLLQIMDDGCLTDSAGYRVDFTNTVIIITGNIGSGEKKTTMGFHNGMQEGENYKIALKKHFRPEFLNRLDDPIVFNELDEKTMLQILWDSLNTTVKNAAKQKITLTVDQSLVDYLLKQAKSQDTHARNIQKLVEKNLNIPLSKRILKDKPKEITAKIENGKLELV